MKKVFSFTLFGSQEKYWKGLLVNINLIHEKFPDWEIWVYIGNDVPDIVLYTLKSFSDVKLIETKEIDMVNKFFRFFPIDDPTVEICIIRDTDSRIYERDESCIRDFISSNYGAHIIRDHPNHHHRLMAGMWGIKQGVLGIPIRVLFDHWRASRNTNRFWDDTEFLVNLVYPRIASFALVHDELRHYEPEEQRMPFKVGILNGLHFVGQVYEYDENSREFPKFPYSV